VKTLPEPHPHHQLRVQGKRGAVDLDVTLTLTAPWTVIFGPSGSGKSSILRAACGLIPSLTTEFRRWQNDAWLDLQTAPTNTRALAYTPQGAAIFPHLTVRQNIEFGGRSLHSPDTAHFVEEAIELFALGPLLDRMPRELSGGERQIVSLARAFAVPNAKLILLDEPFSGIDRSMRDILLPRMRDRLATLGIPAISVTHDVEEPILLGAEVIRLHAGKVTHTGPATEALAEELIRMRRVLNG
jgi:molybdate transport system ATP-binding protein